MFGGTIGDDFGKQDKQEKNSQRNIIAVVAGGIVNAIAASQAHHVAELMPTVNFAPACAGPLPCYMLAHPGFPPVRVAPPNLLPPGCA